MENDTLNKIDEIIKRTNTDYGTAKEALEAANGDVLEAIILIENQQKGSTGSFRGEQIMAQLKDILAKGNATKLTIKKDNEVIVNIPITAGLVSAFIAPFLSAAGITVALLAKCSVEITQTDGKIIDLGQKVDAVKDAMHDIKKGAQNLKDDLRTGSKNIKDDIKTGAENVKDNIKAEAENMKDDLKNSFDRNNVHF
jgi:gas vesicle protein